ncbi:MAG: hypothetical protein WCP85_05145 [Mariniphaga sp.]
MSATELIAKINLGIHHRYSHQQKELAEMNEIMNVPFSRYEDDENLVIIRPKDDERDSLWACFSDVICRDIADYILFKVIDDEVICFILELKKAKTDDSVVKATSQIRSTHPLVKMIYEKTTGENAKNLKTIGIRVFGTGNKSQVKINRKVKRKIPDQLVNTNENFAIGHFIQNKQSENLTSLTHFYMECKQLFVN